MAESFVDSVRGRSGGLLLNQPADTINVGQVARTFEDYGTFVECFDKARNGYLVRRVCGLRHILADGVEAFLQHLDGFTVADLIGSKVRFQSVGE